MSLLEDIFLQDEANEAQELERVIDGDDYDDRPRSAASNSDENSAKEDEAEEDKRRVDPTSAKAKRVVKNPRFILNPARLTGPRGIEVIPDHFKDFKFKGKGHEKDDLDLVLKKLEHWAYRLYPKFGFEDCMKKIETLGKKRPVMVHLQKIRSDQLQSAETVVQRDSSDDEKSQPEDEFDKLLQQQIDIARKTPAPDSIRKPIATPRHVMSPFTMPKATSSPSISDEQKERMIRNRKLAEERRLARLKQNTFNQKLEANVTLKTVHERLSNEYEKSDSSNDERNVIPVTVEINTTTSDKTTKNSKYTSTNYDESVDDQVIQQTNSNDLNVEMVETTNIDKAVDISNHTENTFNNDDKIAKENEEDIIEHNTDNTNDKMYADIYENCDSLEKNIDQEIMEAVKETPNRNTYNQIGKFVLTSEESSNSPRNTDVETSIELEKRNSLEILNGTKDIDIIETVIQDAAEVNKLSKEVNSINGSVNLLKDAVESNHEDIKEKPHHEIDNEKAIEGGSELDKLVETELMDVDFGDEF